LNVGSDFVHIFRKILTHCIVACVTYGICKRTGSVILTSWALFQNFITLGVLLI
jgi:hypothetical protein